MKLTCNLSKQTALMLVPANGCIRVDFANDPSNGAHAGKPYHLQFTKERNVNIKVPFQCVLETNATVISLTPGIETPGVFDLPKRDRNYSFSSFKVVKNNSLDSSTPACIYYETGVCHTGPRFETLPFQWQTYVLLHEKGHLKYSSEYDCDMYALNEFLQAGFNSSQAFYALEQVLKSSPENRARIAQQYDKLKKIMS